MRFPLLTLYYVDDSPLFLDEVQHQLEQSGHFKVKTFLGPVAFQAFLKRKDANAPDILLLDIMMDDDLESGLKLARAAQTRFPNVFTVMYSQFDDGQTIIDHLREGVHNFVSKETPLADLPALLADSYELRLQVGDATPLDKLGLFAGKTMAQIAKRVPRIVRSAVRCVHVYGETGTGKEVVADLFEQAVGKRAPVVRVNCGAISESLLESELFGHRKGAFTGATSDKVGLLEAASGGWVFLDEVALLSKSAQMALLRAIENQVITPVGDTKSKKVNFRILSATNENLLNKVKKREFREDLWQRLRETVIEIPPLRDRFDELEALASHFCKTMDGGPYLLSKAALSVLKQYHWPGNARELRNVLRAMTENASQLTLGPDAIPKSLYKNRVNVHRPEYWIKIPFDPENISLPDLEERLYFLVLSYVMKKNPDASLRLLENLTHVPRATLSRKINLLKESPSPHKLGSIVHRKKSK